uniref:Uncharacterized protein n=2 Tax=Micrurus carvalhoi TaxID=3147026 RepID=A0A2H6N9G4_9SAUR
MLRKFKFLFLFPHQLLPIYEDWKITTLKQQATLGRITQPRHIQESPVCNLPSLASPAHLSYQNRNYSGSIRNGKKLFNPMVHTLYFPFSFLQSSSFLSHFATLTLVLCILIPFHSILALEFDVASEQTCARVSAIFLHFSSSSKCFRSSFSGNILYISGPQPFWHQGLVSWKINFSTIWKGDG